MRPFAQSRAITSPSYINSAAYLGGISFSHEGLGSDGYGSQAARAELGRMRNLGANAVALVPYVFMGAPETTTIRILTLAKPGSSAFSSFSSRISGQAGASTAQWHSKATRASKNGLGITGGGCCITRDLPSQAASTCLPSGTS